MAGRLRRLGWLGANAAAGGMTAVVYALVVVPASRLRRYSPATRRQLARRALGPGADPQQPLRDARRAPLRLPLRQPRLPRLPHQPARRLRHRARPRALAARRRLARAVRRIPVGRAALRPLRVLLRRRAPGRARRRDRAAATARRRQGHRRLPLRRRRARSVGDARARPLARVQRHPGRRGGSATRRDVRRRLALFGRWADVVLGCADLVEDLPRLDGVLLYPFDADGLAARARGRRRHRDGRACAQPPALQGHAIPRWTRSSGCGREGLPVELVRRGRA